MEVDATAELRNSSTQPFENSSQGEIQTRLLDYLGHSLKKTVPGSHIYKLYALSTLPVIKTLFKTQVKKSHERTIVLFLSEKKISTQKEVLMTSIEVHEYYMIEEKTLYLYISKVDTTGCTISDIKDKKISATKQLISSYINYHLEEGIQPKYKYINVHVFARSQPQYLFTKSSKNPEKHVLVGMDLLKWWKKVLGQASAVFTATNNNNVRKWYYIPGDLSESKAKSLMEDNKNDGWVYGYPYDNESKVDDVIPKFDDDAKARWLDHFHNENDENDKNNEVDDDDDDEDDEDKDEDDNNEIYEDDKNDKDDEVENGEDDENDRDDENDENDNINVREFWEMIGIGGEFSDGKIAGFFWVNIERLTNENLEQEEYENNSLEYLKKNVGGITLNEQEFIKILQKFFELEFDNEEIAFKSSEDWSKIFNDLCVQKGIDNGVLEFKVEQPQSEVKEGTSQNSAEIDMKSNETSGGGAQEEGTNLRSNSNKRKPVVIDNDSKKINVLLPSLIKRAKK